MAKSRQSHTRRLAALYLFASIVSAQRAVSLTSFELISSILVAPECLDAYNTPLEDCQIRDFLFGTECSSSCIANLERVETNLQRACSRANPRPGTLLFRIKDGELVTALCGPQDNDDNNDEDDEEEFMTTFTTTTRPGTGLPMRTTTVTKAITPRPSPISTTSTEEEPETTEESSTEESTAEETTTEAESSSSSLELPSSSTSTTQEAETTELPPTRAPRPPPTLLNSDLPGNTAVADDDEDAGDGGFGDDGAVNDDDDGGRLPGSGGGGLDGVGFEGSGMMATSPRVAWMAAIVGIAIGWQAL